MTQNNKNLQKILEELKNTRENNKFLVKKLEKTRKTNPREKIEKIDTVPIIYSCDVCQSTKNSKIDGAVYRIKITARPDMISNVCPSCRPHVVMIHEFDWENY